MTITTFFSKEGRFPQLYRFTLRQNAGYFGLTSLLVFLLYPVQYLMEIFKRVPEASYAYLPEVPDPFSNYRLYGLGRNFTEMSMVLFTMLFLLLPFVLALMLNSYMHSKKAADVYHSLPVRRETLLVINAAVAMTIITVPLLISNIIVAAAATIKFGGAAPVGYQLLDMVCWLACAALIYSITTCVCVRAGSVFDTFLFSGVLFFTCPILLATIFVLGESFLYGFFTPPFFGHLALWLSPVLFPIDRFSYYYNNYRFGTDMGDNSIFSNYFPGSNIAMILYFVLAIALLLLAMKLYSRRHSEMAETATSKGFLPSVILLIGTVIGSIYTGLLFYYTMDESTFAYFLWAIIGGLVVFAVLAVILNRGFKTLSKEAPKGAAMTAAAILASVIMVTGGLGYSSRVPKLESLKSAETNWRGFYEGMGQNFYRNTELTTQETMNALIEYQKAVIESHKENPNKGYDDFVNENKIPAYARMSLIYKKNGSAMYRHYNEMVSSDVLEKLIPLEVDESFQRQVNPFFLLEPDDIDTWIISDPFGWNQQKATLSPADNKRLLEAVQADWLAQDEASLLHPTQPVLAHLAILPKRDYYDKEAVITEFRSGYVSAYDSEGEIYMPVSGANTIAVLREMRLLPGEPDLKECIGAAVDSSHDYDVFYDDETGTAERHFTIRDSLVNFINQILDNGETVYQTRKEELAQAQKDGNRYDITTYLEDPEDIKALANAIVPTWRADEACVAVTFYSKENNTLCRSVLVPLSKLPVPLQQKLEDFQF